MHYHIDGERKREREKVSLCLFDIYAARREREPKKKKLSSLPPFDVKAIEAFFSRLETMCLFTKKSPHFPETREAAAVTKKQGIIGAHTHGRKEACG